MRKQRTWLYKSLQIRHQHLLTLVFNMVYHNLFNLNTNINVEAYICGSRIFMMINGYSDCVHHQSCSQSKLARFGTTVYLWVRV